MRQLLNRFGISVLVAVTVLVLYAMPASAATYNWSGYQVKVPRYLNSYFDKILGQAQARLLHLFLNQKNNNLYQLQSQSRRCQNLSHRFLNLSQLQAHLPLLQGFLHLRIGCSIRLTKSVPKRA